MVDSAALRSTYPKANVTYSFTCFTVYLYYVGTYEYIAEIIPALKTMNTSSVIKSTPLMAFAARGTLLTGSSRMLGRVKTAARRKSRRRSQLAGFPGGWQSAAPARPCPALSCGPTVLWCHAYQQSPTPDHCCCCCC